MINGKREQIIQKTTIDQAIEKMLGGIGKPHTCIPALIFKKSHDLIQANPSHPQSSADNLQSSIGPGNTTPYERATV